MARSNVLQVPDYETYLAKERQTLLARYVVVERDLGSKRIEYAQVLGDEKRTKAEAWRQATANGASATAADRASEHGAVHAVTESIQLRAELDVLEREAALLLYLLREA